MYKITDCTPSPNEGLTFQVLLMDKNCLYHGRGRGEGWERRLEKTSEGKKKKKLESQPGTKNII